MKRTNVLTLLLLTVVLIAGCGEQNNSSNAKESEPTADHEAESDRKKGKFGFAREKQKRMKAEWGIAFLNEQENELILVFYPKTPDQSLINKIKEKRGFTGVNNVEKPYIEVTFGLYDDASFSGEAVKKYSMFFSNFSKTPMTLARPQAEMDKVQLKLDGTLKKGGRIKGMFKGSQDFKLEDPDEYNYSWDLEFDLPIQ